MIQFKHRIDVGLPRDRRVLNMTPDGQFRDPPPPRAGSLARIGGIAFLVAIVGGALAIAALALWFALAIIPVVLVAGAVAYGVFRFQLWRAQGGFAARRGPPG